MLFLSQNPSGKEDYERQIIWNRSCLLYTSKVKTETELSKTSVSTATLALKVAEEELGTLKDKKVLIIGATGKIGGIVLMNIQSLHQADIYAVSYTHLENGIKEGIDGKTECYD